MKFYLFTSILPLFFYFFNQLYAIKYYKWTNENVSPKIFKLNFSLKIATILYYTIPLIFPFFCASLILINSQLQSNILWGCYLIFSEVLCVFLTILSYLSCLGLENLKFHHIIFTKRMILHIIYITSIPIIYFYVFKIMLISVNGINTNCL